MKGHWILSNAISLFIDMIVFSPLYFTNTECYMGYNGHTQAHLVTNTETQIQTQRNTKLLRYKHVYKHAQAGSHQE